MILVLDACALVALLAKEPGAEVINSLLLDRNNTCVIHALNLCEVYYDIARSAGDVRAKETIKGLIKAGVFVREDMDTEFWQSAGDIKAIHSRVSLADCIGITLANRLGVEIWTCDHHEFDLIAEKELCKVRFIR